MKCLWDLCVCSGAGAVVSLWAYWTAESFPPDLWVLSPGPPPSCDGAAVLVRWHGIGRRGGGERSGRCLAVDLESISDGRTGTGY